MTLASHVPLKPIFRRTAVALAMVAAGASAYALPMFTLNPSAVSPTLAGTTIVADNILVSDFSTVRYDLAGNFTDTGYLSVSAFQLGGLTLEGTGLNSTFGMYFKFTGAGTTTPGNPSTTSTTGTFTSLTYELYGYNGTASFGFDGANVPTETALGEVLLASGSLINGTVSSTPDSGPGPEFTPSASAALTFNPAAAQLAFFAAPVPFYNLSFAAFTNTTTQVEGFDGGFRIRQGGGAVNFGITPAVPEPQTYALMLAGLAAIGFVARRRRRVD